MENFLGVDIGGTNVKVGIVNPDGQIKAHQKFPTIELSQKSNFLGNFMEMIGEVLSQNPDIGKVGIGVPGVLDKARTTPLEVPAIPDLNGKPLKAALEKQYRDVQFWLENDVNAAALGEYYFSREIMPRDYIFITLGTGVGGAAVINKEIFKGADGNGMEIGHFVSSKGKKLEHVIGNRGILDMAGTLLKYYQGHSLFKKREEITISKLVIAASMGDGLAQEVFDEVGELLGEALVATIRVLDIKNIFIGGGISSAFDYIKDAIYHVFDNYLSHYYRGSIELRRAYLQNEAGIIGAASLCFKPVSKSIS